MSKPTREYVVVENAGYERECDTRRFPTYDKAQRFIKRQYYADELNPESPSCLHVEIAVEIDGQRTYEI